MTTIVYIPLAISITPPYQHLILIYTWKNLKKIKIRNLDHVVSTNMKYNNQVNGVVDNGLELYSNFSLARNPIKEPHTVVTTILR